MPLYRPFCHSRWKERILFCANDTIIIMLQQELQKQLACFPQKQQLTSNYAEIGHFMKCLPLQQYAVAGKFLLLVYALEAVHYLFS